jgi:23S rRNA G2445 N2-methylase RlmL
VAEQTIRVDVTAVKSPLKSVDFVTLRIKDAVCDRFRRDGGTRPSVDTRQPDMRVHGFIGMDDHCTLYLDTSGAPLYQRGFARRPSMRRSRKIWPPAFCASAAGSPALRCSTRCAAAAPF